MIVRVDGGSNKVLVTSSSLIHDSVQTKNEVGTTGGGITQTNHAGDLHMTLEDVDKSALLTMKQALAVPSNNHNTFGLSPFLLH